MSSQSSDTTKHAFSGAIRTPLCTWCSIKPPAISQCRACQNYLCLRCDSSHSIMACFQAQNTHIPLVSNSNNKKCANHPEQEVTACCFSCLDFMCDICANVTHSIHEIRSLIDTEVEVKVTLEELFHRGKNAMQMIYQLDTQLKQDLEHLRQCKLNSLACVNKMCVDYQEILEKQRCLIVENLEETFSVHHNTILEKRSQIEEKVGDFMNKLSDIGATLSRPNITAPQTNEFYQNSFPSPPESSSLKQSDTTSETNNNHKKSDNDDDDEEQYGHAINIEKLLDDDSDKATSDPISSCSSSNKHVNSVQIYKTFGQRGASTGQFNTPHGFCLGFDEDIVVADTCNHRIQIFDKSGNFKRQFGVSGRHDGSLWYPRRVAVLPTQRQFVICDRGYDRSRMQIFTEDGVYVRKLYIEYIDIVSGMVVNDEELIVVLDSVTPTLFVLGQNEYLRSFDCRSFMLEPSDLAIYKKNYYICDFKGHCVCVMDPEGNLLKKIGCSTITTFPNGIDISSNGEIVVGDSHGNFFHISVFSQDGTLLNQFRCTYLKVSRCCGLKINSSGHIVTVDKNYHHIIMLDTPYFTDGAKNNLCKF